MSTPSICSSLERQQNYIVAFGNHANNYPPTTLIFHSNHSTNRVTAPLEHYTHIIAYSDNCFYPKVGVLPGQKSRRMNVGARRS